MTLEAPICQPFMKGTSQTWRESYHIFDRLPNDISIYCSCLVNKNATFVESQDSQTQPLSVVGEHLENFEKSFRLTNPGFPAVSEYQMAPGLFNSLDLIPNFHRQVTHESVKMKISRSGATHQKQNLKEHWTKLTILSCIILFHQTLSNKNTSNL